MAEIDRELAGLAARARRATAAVQQAGEARGRLAQLRTLAERAAGRLERMDDRERRTVLEALDLRVEVLGWSTCSTCKGAGKVKGGKGGLVCPGCGWGKQVPHLRIWGSGPRTTTRSVGPIWSMTWTRRTRVRRPGRGLPRHAGGVLRRPALRGGDAARLITGRPASSGRHSYRFTMLS